MGPGKLAANPIDALSLGLALMFGTAGLPHILMRFFTVKTQKKRVNQLSLQQVLLVTSIF